MAPVAVAFLLPTSIIMEEDVIGITISLAREDSSILWLLMFNSALAYFANLTNFLVTKHTSALTLQVIIPLPFPIEILGNLQSFSTPRMIICMEPKFLHIHSYLFSVTSNHAFFC